MYIVEFQCNCQVVRGVLSRFSTAFSSLVNDWANFDLGLRACFDSPNPEASPELQTMIMERAKKIIVNTYEDVEIRLPLVTVGFREGQAVRFQPVNSTDILVRCLLTDSSVLELVDALVKWHVNFNGKRSF